MPNKIGFIAFLIILDRDNNERQQAVFHFLKHVK